MFAGWPVPLAEHYAKRESYAQSLDVSNELMCWRRFLQQRSVPRDSPGVTHQIVQDGYFSSTGALRISEEELPMLQTCVEFCWQLGYAINLWVCLDTINLTRPPTFAMNIDIGYCNDEDLALQLIGYVAEILRQSTDLASDLPLDCIVYGYSGWRALKNANWVSMMTVWPQISESNNRWTFAQLRERVIFNCQSDMVPAEIQTRIRNCNASNTWSYIFDNDLPISLRSLCYTEPKFPPEGRSLQPMGILRFAFPAPGYWLARSGDLSTECFNRLMCLRAGDWTARIAPSVWSRRRHTGWVARLLGRNVLLLLRIGRMLASRFTHSTHMFEAVWTERVIPALILMEDFECQQSNISNASLSALREWDLESEMRNGTALTRFGVLA